MTSEPTLFPGLEPGHMGTDAHTLARRGDPDTSKEAAEQVATHLAHDRAYALECVTAHPGSTARELEYEYGTGVEGAIRKRLSELEYAGLVWRGLKRKCRINGTSAAVWWPAERSGT